MSIISSAKKTVRYALPLPLRKALALWINRQRWLPPRHHWTQGLLQDFMHSDPKGFHKFLWGNHLSSYASWYDSEDLFLKEKMELSRRIFFDDIVSVMKDLGHDSNDLRSALEVGCSLGYLLRFIEEDIFPSTNELIGIDIDPEAIEMGGQYLDRVGSKVRLICGDMEDLDRLLGVKSFDLVFAGGVLSYLSESDARKVVKAMLCRTNKVLALIGLACTTRDNSELETSILSGNHNNQWLHNFKSMVEQVGGTVLKCRWEGAKQFNFQTIYAVYAVPCGAASFTRRHNRTE